MKIFILEDDPNRMEAFLFALTGHEVTVAHWLNGGKGAYEVFKPPYHLILLDHDLGGEVYVDPEKEETGTSFVKWLKRNFKADESLKTTPIFIHSWNTGAAIRMEEELNDLGWKIRREVYSQYLLKILTALPLTHPSGCVNEDR